MITRYTNWLTLSPIKSRMASTGTLLLIGDTLCQTVIERRGFRKEKEWDFKRAARMVLWGTLFLGPGLYGWYNLCLPSILGLRMFKNWGKLR